MKKSPPPPPAWADQFLQWFVDEDLLEEIQGDLHEAYEHRVQTQGLSKAKWLFVEDVFRFFRPYAFEKYSNAKQFMPMFSNYFKIALRNIIHRKEFTAINLFGLSIGIAAVLLIGIYLQNEFSYDQATPQHDRIYRLANNYREQVYTCMQFGKFNESSSAEQLKLVQHLNNYSEVETAAHFLLSDTEISGQQQYYLEVENRRYVQENILFTNTGSDFLAIFPQKFLVGSPSTALAQYQQIVITKNMAERFFGDDWHQQQLLGKIFKVGEQTYTLAGVIDNLPSNLHYDFDIILSQSLIPSWAAYTYVKIRPKISPTKVMAQLNKEIDLVYPGYSEDELSKGVQAIALTDIHFTKGTLYEIKPIANVTYLYTFGLIGFIILLIIWTNYTNLSIAMYADRQKELGVRKVMGARSQDISLQLLVEAVVLTLLCFPIAWALLLWLLPKMNDALGLNLDNRLLYSLPTFGVLLGVLVLTGLFSGLYPAMRYGQKSITRLFSATLSGRNGHRLFNFRNSLVAVQFVLLVSLLSVTFFIYQQMNFITSKDLGFQQEGVLFFQIDGAEKYQQLKNILSTIPEIESIGTGDVPGWEMYNQSTYKMKDADLTLSDGTQLFTSNDALKVLQIDCPSCEEIEKGKDRIFVINQTAANKLAKTRGVLPSELIGQTLILEPEYENERYGFGIPRTIDGIIEDYDYFSLKYDSQPLLIDVVKEPTYVSNVLLKANTGSWNNTLSQIEDAYETVETNTPFNYTFLEERIQKLYAAEQQSGILMSGLSLVAVILALMGLAGIVSFIAFNRQKEISIRKVYGASIQEILWLINKDFIVLMGIATLIAAPIALYLADQWLDNFAFSIAINPLVIALAGLMALGLVVFVVSLQSRRTAQRNPVDVLKND